MSCDRNSFGEYFSRDFSVKSYITFKECNIEVYNLEKAFKQFSHGFETVDFIQIKQLLKKIVTFKSFIANLFLPESLQNRQKMFVLNKIDGSNFARICNFHCSSCHKRT